MCELGIWNFYHNGTAIAMLPFPFWDRVPELSFRTLLLNIELVPCGLELLLNNPTESSQIIQSLLQRFINRNTACHEELSRGAAIR